ncbi:MAG: hypothetical protein HY914_14145 [Desulfomonile tiedjei]|nr:hypothetical protein [Desulfomonile tiedjei]
MDAERTVCVTCAWRQTCNKKFSMDGATTTRCVEYTRDLALKEQKADEGARDQPSDETRK